MIIAKQSTATIVTVGPVLDADGVAVTDGVVGDFKLSKNGGAPAALNGSATLTHRNTGHYSLSLTATDLNTVGTAEIVIDDTVNACPIKEIQVVEEVIYDALFAASANAFAGAAGSTTLGSGAITATVIATGAIDADAIADNAIDAGAIAADAITAAKIANGAIDAATFAADVDAEILSYIVDDATRIDASSLNTASVTSIPAILADTGTDGVVVAAASKTGYALSAAGLADFFDTDSGTTYASAVAGSVVKEIADNAGGSSLTAAEIADAVWDEDATGHQTQGTFGQAIGDPGADTDTIWALANTNLNATVSSRASQASVDTIDGIVDSILVDTAEIGVAGAGLTAADDAVITAIAALNNITAASVWAVGTRSLTVLDEDSTTLDLDATIRAAVGLSTANLDTQLADFPTVAEFEARTLVAASYFDPAADTVANVTTVGSVTTKTGYELASTGLDAIVATTPNGVASTFATKLMQLWARFFGRVTKDSDEIKTYRTDGSTVATTQTYTSSGSDDDVGAAS